MKQGSPFLRPEKMHVTTATPLEEALIGLCSPGAPSPSTAEELTLHSLTRWRMNRRATG